MLQPLLYQVATAALAPGDIAMPIRSIFKENKNIQVLMGEVLSVGKNKKAIILENGNSIILRSVAVRA